jgi:cysteine desulfurase
MNSVYLDHAATTPILASALSAFTEQAAKLGNPSSLHTQGRAARKDLEDAREAIAQAAGALPSEIIFTASGTEANNIALKGLYWLGRKKNCNVIVISAIEHHAILDPANWLVSHEGAELIIAPVNQAGYLDLDFIQNLILTRGNEIAVISVMHSNNETGVLQPIAELVKLAGDIPVHSDAVQSFGKVELNFEELGLFAMTLSAHKIGGPLGIGILVLRRAIEIPALLHGGGQEREIRSGTLNAPAIVAFAAAIKANEYDGNKIAKLRDEFAKGVIDQIPDAFINGADFARLPGIVNITFPRTQSDTLLLLLDSEKVSCSTGSACSAGVHRPSHVLMAMGHDDISAQSSLRFSFGPSNTAAEVEYVLSVLPQVIQRGRAAVAL